ncbi:hypothetical protein KOI35_37465 [Actinoplanes bogorensis]|uniref:Type II toxin-antitoxin system PemK/MazF family toxin n=1 Tax=Paractinoplanes bogorensis TaxID=1610840 RepID=A0ABS5Z1L3_9ACTN|nr:hypothetical protein [Actinoplanes bogorensis]MBU2669216.1 hypothetical protein [Actinoplanes bogorensis]
MERGEVWLAEVDGIHPIVLLNGDAELRGMQIVPAATPKQRRGFVFLDPADPVAPDPSAGIAGIEIPVGADEGLDPPGVVRLALPRDGHIFCTWQITLTPVHLRERVGRLAPPKLRMLSRALHLSGAEPA